MLSYRDRPKLRENVLKYQHFRKKEKNFSIPSGDTIQAALFSYFLYYVYGVNWVIAAMITVLVAISRVYFMCHWIGDTIFAVIIEGPMALGLIYLREPVILIVKEIAAKYGISL